MVVVEEGTRVFFLYSRIREQLKSNILCNER